MQRWQGFDPSFAHDVFAILNAAEGRAPQDVQEDAADCCTIVSDDESVDARHEEKVSPLSTISDMLRPQAPVEARRLALSSLASLTNPELAGRVAASRISDELLGSESHRDLRRALALHIAKGGPWDFSRLKSLEVLSNVADCSQGSSLVELLSHNQDELLLRLVANVEDAARDPHGASLSCSVLEGVLTGSPRRGLPKGAAAEGLERALEEGAKVGRECHADLEERSTQCMESIRTR